MANLNLSQFTEKTFVADADWVFVWDAAGLISKKVSRNSLLSVGSIATSTPVTINQTWNDAAVAFASMKIVATDTNSAAGSDFLELYSGTSTQPLRLDIQKSGQINIYGTWTNSTTYERLSLSAPTAANAIIGTNRSGGTARGLDFHTEGTARMTIGTTGNVGIGTTAPAAKLDILTSASDDGIKITNSGTTSSRISLYNNSGHLAYFCSFGSSIGFGLTNNASFGGQNSIVIASDATAASGGTNSVQFRAGGYNADQERMRITAAGNVGIGTTAPSSKLQVSAGDVEVDTIAKGVILKSPDGTRYRVTVANGGTLSVAAV